MTPRVSGRIVEHLLLLTKLEPADRRKLADRLRLASVGLYPFTVVSDAVKAVAPPHFTTEDAENLGGALGSIAFALVSSSSEPLSNGVTKFLGSLEVSLEPTQYEVIGPFLTEYAGLKSLFTSFKATALYEDGESVVLGSRIVIDMRPVFDIDDVSTIAATAVLFRLRLTYRAPNGKNTETVAFAFHEGELSELEDAIKRAEDKVATLRRRLENGALGTILEEHRK